MDAVTRRATHPDLDQVRVTLHDLAESNGDPPEQGAPPEPVESIETSEELDVEDRERAPGHDAERDEIRRRRV